MIPYEPSRVACMGKLFPRLTQWWDRLRRRRTEVGRPSDS
jgi:hypothetical protein